MKPFGTALFLLLTACAVQAQPIYRCGTEYSQTPCPGGKLLESSDPRSAAQRTEAIRVAAQDRRRAAELERERRAQEKASRPARAAGFNGRPAPPDEAAPAAERGKAKKTSKANSTKDTAKGAAFVAVEPVKPKAAGAK